MNQLTFDLDHLLRQAEIETAPDWNGAPLHYHERYTDPTDLDTAWGRWIFEHGRSGSIPDSHMWHRGQGVEAAPLVIQDHDLHLFRADANCSGRDATADHRHAPGELPGAQMTQAICAVCRWHHISSDENAAVEAWHTHAIPDWRRLPVVPLHLSRHTHTASGRARLDDWVTSHYAAGAQQPGYPIITARLSHATRHVPGRSPFGGYDLAATSTGPAAP